MKDSKAACRDATRLALAMSLTLLLPAATVQAQQGYQKPPPAVADVLDATPFPQPSVSPARDRLLLVEGVRYPSITELAEPMLRLAGIRINPKTNGLHNDTFNTDLTIRKIPEGTEIKVTPPPNSPGKRAQSRSPRDRTLTLIPPRASSTKSSPTSTPLKLTV